jgi:hypothetical protein
VDAIFEGFQARRPTFFFLSRLEALIDLNHPLAADVKQPRQGAPDRPVVTVRLWPGRAKAVFKLVTVNQSSMVGQQRKL